jgi:hypothetical protein
MARTIDEHGLSALTRTLLWVALGLTVLHHIDHVLRVDHSGWPFKPEVTPFTYSLLAYPMILFGLFGARRLFWWRWAALAIGTAFTLYAHTLVETPGMQFAIWANDMSSDPMAMGEHNLLDAHSTALGIAAVTVAMSLNILAVLSTVSMYIDGRRLRPVR